MVKIAPSILSANFATMGEAVKEIARDGADLIHVDVMDGVFVPNLTFGFKMIKDIKPLTNVPLDVHLMITEPERYIDEFIKSGADILTIHYEAVKTDIVSVLKKIRELGAKSAISIKPDTDVSVLKEFLPYVDMILLMSVYPGFGGQKFIEESVERAKQISLMIKESGFDIDFEIDGGITEENVRRVKDAGVNVIVAGSTVFKAKDKKVAISSLRNN
ncbi:MAG: ribulose-phosphate 3-epimerase [Clostridia bacterium]|nr:ribulose-phosphate 3-epimerase [Clostridia bacterium]